tara:strand:- start:1344 stop:1967 length:624 start_codon:yes stop_codon:yes gene_type:complete
MSLLYSENWVHGQEDHFIKKYSDDFYFKQLFDDKHKSISGNGVTKEKIRINDYKRKGIVSTQDKISYEYGQHWTGYYKNEEGSDLDTELLQLYVPKLKEILQILGLYGEGRIYSYQSIWGQLSKKDVPCYMKEHTHGKENKVALSWVHFVKVPEQKCFYFKTKEKVYPECQKSGDLIVFPNYMNHGVDERIDLDERFVIVGNIIRTK